MKKISRRPKSPKRVCFPYSAGTIEEWSPIQRYGNCVLSFSAYLRQVKEALGKCPNFYAEFIKQLAEMKNDSVEKIATIERLITLLDGHPRLILNLMIFMPHKYVLEIQADAVIIKVFESDNSISLVDTGHCRSFYNKPILSSTGEGQNNLQDLLHPKIKHTSLAKPCENLVDTEILNLSNTNKQNTNNNKTPSLKESSYTMPYSELNTTASEEKQTLSYIMTVKKLYATRPLVYKRFMEILKNFHGGIIGELNAVRAVISLLKGQSSLVIKFNEFLPKGYRIINIAILSDKPSYILEHPDENGELVQDQFYL